MQPARGDGPRILPIALPVPIEGVRVWAYLVIDDPLTLIDVGPDTDAAYAAVRDGLASAGVGIDALRRIVITHAHFDHCGLAGRLHADSGARVAAHPLALTALADFDVAWSARLALVERAAHAGAVPEAVLGAFQDGVRSRGALVGALPRDAMEPLSDGDAIRFGDAGAWRVFHCPGHSPDHIGLHHARSGTTIGGDLVLRGVATVPFLEPRRPDGTRPATFDDLLASWRRLARIASRVVLPGHGAPIRAHRVLLARRLAESRAALASTRDAVRGGATTLWEIAGATELATEPAALAMTLGHVVARLDALVRRGIVERRSDGGRLRFTDAKDRRRAGHAER